MERRYATWAISKIQLLDLVKEENDSLSVMIENLVKISSEKDKIITNKNSQVSILTLMNENNKSLYEISNKSYVDLERKYKKTVRGRRAERILAIAVGLFLGYQAIK